MPMLMSSEPLCFARSGDSSGWDDIIGDEPRARHILARRGAVTVLVILCTSGVCLETPLITSEIRKTSWDADMSCCEDGREEANGGGVEIRSLRWEESARGVGDAMIALTMATPERGFRDEADW